MTAHRRTLTHVFTILLVAALLAGVLPPAPALAQTNPPPTAATETAARPALLSVSPAQGSAWNGEPVAWSFDRWVAVADAGVAPTLPGAWEVAADAAGQGSTVTFRAEGLPVQGERYRFRLSVFAVESPDLMVGVLPGAAPAAEADTIALFEHGLTGATPLKVTATTPNDGATDIATGSSIVVTWNRPVVALAGADQSGVPAPGLAFEPALEGSGRWITTSIYEFSPENGLAGATSYSVTVAPMATQVSGEQMAEPFTFGFETAAPVVEYSAPSGMSVSPDAAVEVTFSQAMDPAGAEAAFSLTRADDGKAVAGAFAWSDSGLTLYFTPTAPLERGALYQMEVDKSAPPATGQGGLRGAFSSSFMVAALPALLTSAPADGATGVLPEQQISIRFTTVLSRETLLDAITISPMLTTTSVYSWYNDWDGELTLVWQKQANTEYTVTIGGAAEDLYGVPLGDDIHIRFTTGDFSPFVRLDLENYTHFTPITDTNVSLFYRNVDELQVALFALPLSAFVATFSGNNSWDAWQSYRPDEAELIWSRTYTATETRNETYQRVITLDDGEGHILPPGLYIVETQQPQGQLESGGTIEAQARSLKIVAISSRSLVLKKSLAGQSLAWVTDAANGEPVSGAEVTFATASGSGGSAITDEEGVALAELNLSQEDSWLPVVAWSGDPGSDSFAVVSSEWNSGIAPWDFSVAGGYLPEAIQSFFYTDRPLYRPGQTVHWRGIVRRFENDQLVLPEPSMAMTVTVRNDRGDAILTQRVSFNDNGTLNGSLLLPPDSFSGSYYIEALLQLGPNRMHYGGTGFQVASYVKPEFEVSITPEEPELRQGETLRVTVAAKYYSGGPLADAPVEWSIIAQPYEFTWDDAPDGRWFAFTPWDPTQERYDPYASMFYGLLKEGRGRTDAQGDFVLELPADLGTSLQSQRWMVYATLQSPTNQFVGGNTEVVVHRADLYVGQSPRAWVTNAGDETTIDVVALRPDGKFVAGQELEATLFELRWNNVQELSADGRYVWTSSVERTAQGAQRLTTGADGMAELRLTPPLGGQYEVVVQGEDEQGNDVASSLYLWVSNQSPTAYTPWQRENNDRIELVADKQSYNPGETARILVPSPFLGATTGLVTLERSGVVEYRIVTLESNSDIIEVPLTAEHVPNVFVGVVLLRGIDESNPAPAIRVGYVQLNVATEVKVLSLDVSVQTPKMSAPGALPAAQPGETVTYTIEVKDFSGEPVAGAEVSVAVVDKALLAIANDYGITLLERFYSTRPLGVTTAGTLIINRDRMAQQLSDGAKGGGGGGGGEMFDVRQEFPDTALWHADLVSDEEGRITFALVLPDNLTTWSLRARAVTVDTLVGEAQHELIVSRPLQVRPLLPRFFSAGDHAQLGAQVLNASGLPLESGVYTVTVEGADVAGAVVGALDFGDDGRNPNAQITFDVHVPDSSEAVTVTILALAQGPDGPLTDGVRRVLPVARYTTSEVSGTAGSVEGVEIVEHVLAPASATEQGALILGLEPSLAAGMTQGLSYLRHFPWECTEQTVSRFLPNIFTARAVSTLELEALDLVSNEMVGDLDAQLGTGVQALLARQNADGGWGNWPGEESNRFVTTYALWGLWNARLEGQPVSATVLDRAVDYLDRTFVAPSDLEATDAGRSTLNSLAFVHFVLAEMGEGDPGRMSTLFDVRERLDHYGRALLAMALAADNADDPRVQTLLDDLQGAAVQTGTAAWWQEERVDLLAFNTDVRSTAIVLDAFSRLRPDAALLPAVVRWLMHSREAAIWSNTQENAWSLIALTDWMTASGELEADYAWAVGLNGVEVAAGAFDSRNLMERVELRLAVADLLRDEVNAVAISRTNESGRLEYTLHLEYFVDAADAQAADHGVVVDRVFTLNDEPITRAQVGDVFSVTVTVVAPTILHQLVVEVPIPAGTEVIDPNLAGARALPVWGMTSSAPSWRDWMPVHRDYRDDKVALFDTALPAGTWQYTFWVRATTPGEFRVLPARAEMLYFREVWGRSAGAIFTVTD